MDPINNIVPAYVGQPVLCDNASNEAWRGRKLVAIGRQEVLDICVQAADAEEDGQRETATTTASAATTASTAMAVLGWVTSTAILTHILLEVEHREHVL